MGSSRQPLRASSNVSGPTPPPTSSSSSSSAALTGASLAFLKALPPEEALKHLNKRSPPPAPPTSSKPPIPRHVRPSPSPPARRDFSAGGDRSLPERLTVPKRSQPPPSSTAAGLAAVRASPAVRAKSPPSNGPSTRSSSQASLRAAEAVYVPSPPKRTSPPVSSTSRKPLPHAPVTAKNTLLPTQEHSPPSSKRTSPPSSKMTSPPSSKRTSPPSSKRTSPDKLDQSPIPPTTSLVELFERKAPSPVIPSPKPNPVRKAPILKPTPFRNLPLEPISTRLGPNSPRHEGYSSDDSFASARDHLSPDGSKKPDLPPMRRSNKRIDTGGKVDGPSEPAIRVEPPSRDASHSQLSQLSHVSLPPPTSRNSSATRSMPISRQHSPNPLIHPQNQSIHAAYNQLHPRRMTPLRTGDSLANAIVASSLASSRAPSPAKPPSLPQPQAARRSSHTKSSHSNFFSRTPSPPKKGMRHTLRKTSDSDTSSDEGPYDKHKKKRHMRKHPNKHHEGDRKRWRDAVTERERKRYEGVWAANKGNCVQYTSSEVAILSSNPQSNESDRIITTFGDQVSDLVVRDIWTRSRLPCHELEQVWDLVDNQGCGRLTREEFVVGLWLVDQRLKGRKLPVKVTDSVWRSVRLLSGIKLRRN